MPIANLLVPSAQIPQSDFSWVKDVFGSIGKAIDQKKEDKSFSTLADMIGGDQATAPSAPNSPSASGPSSSYSAAPVGPVSRGPAQGSTYQPFIETVRGKITNPYGLAAVAATGRAESGWSPEKANSTWADPSVSGQPGTSGGILSWRGPRLQALQTFAAQKGERLGSISPQTQAEFFLNEDPGLIERLNQAGSPQEAADTMANAWRFAGYDQQGGEAARRRALAQNYYAQEFGRGNQASAAIDQAAPRSGYVDPMVSAPNSRPQGFDAGRFGSGPEVQGEEALIAQLTAGNEAAAAPAPAAPPAAAFAPQPSQQPQMQPQAQPPQAQSNLLAAGVTPIQRGGVDPKLIQFMLRDKNLRQAGLQLWQQNATGKTSEPWQFVNLPDGTLARANQQTGAIERVGNFAKPNEDATVVGDNLVRRSTGEVIYEGKPKTPQSYNEYQLAKQGGFQGTYADWEKVKVPGVTVNNQPGEGSAAKAAGEGLGKLFSGIFDAGMSAQEDKASVGLLRSSLANSPNGVLGGLASIASDYGINLGPNADQVQVAKAVIAKMVPAQRVPGSGTSSDRDLTMFQNGLPRMSGTAEGNVILLDTLDALADHKAAQADIVAGFYSGEKTQAQVVKELRSLPDPYAAYKNWSKSQGSDTSIGGAGAQSPGGQPQRARNPQTGEVLELRDGKWVPVK